MYKSDAYKINKYLSKFLIMKMGLSTVQIDAIRKYILPTALKNSSINDITQTVV